MKEKKKIAKTVAAKAGKQNAESAARWIYMALVVVITLIAFSPTLKNSNFLDYDDDHYITKNEIVTAPTPGNLNQPVMGTYLPLTLFSFWLNYHVSGPDASVFHVTNVLLHVCNVLILFALIFNLAPGTKNSRLRIAFIVAALFAIHPMHVESVTWISERKDVLYTLFYFAALLVYTQYIQNGRLVWLVAVVGLFLLSLLSKGQAVTLPLLLVLVDYLKGREQLSRKVLLEKAPFFLLALLFGIAAVWAQGSATQNKYGIAERLLFANYALAQYLVKAVWPVELALIYQYPVKTGGAYNWLVYASPLIVLLLLAGLYKMRNQPPLLFGALVFLSCIFPLIVLPVGGVLYADRYSYVCYVGLFFILAVMLEKFYSGSNQNFRALAIVVFGACLLVSTGMTYARNELWQSNKDLWFDLAQKQPGSIANVKLATVYQTEGKLDSAFTLLNQSLQFDSTNAEAYLDRAFVYGSRNNLDAALSDCNAALKYSPDDARVYQTRGTTYAIMGKLDLAVADFNHCIANPKGLGGNDILGLYQNMAQLYKQLGKTDSMQLMQNRIAALKDKAPQQ